MGIELMDELVCGDQGSSAKILKTFAPPEIENISDPVMENFVSTLQLHLTHSAEVIFGPQVSISLLNSKMVDMQKYHTTNWVDMGDIMNKLMFHGAVLKILMLARLRRKLERRT